MSKQNSSERQERLWHDTLPYASQHGGLEESTAYVADLGASPQGVCAAITEQLSSATQAPRHGRPCTEQPVQPRTRSPSTQLPA